MTESVIALKNVDMYYDKYHALKNISFDVISGQIYSYLGPNGSGKSTTIKIILGLLKPSSGSIKILGEDPYLDTKKSLELRRQIGSMLEWDGLYLNLTGLENIIYWAEIYGLKKEKALKRAIDVFRKVKLLDWANTSVSKYSHGMKKRLSFARAIVNDPDILVLDEPTSGINPESRMIIRKLMKNFVEHGKTIFFSSHDLEEVQKVSSSSFLLNNGKIIFKGSLEEFRKSFSFSKVFVLMKNHDEAMALSKKLNISTKWLQIKGPIISFILKEGFDSNLAGENIISSWTEEPSLEDVYMNAISFSNEVEYE